MKVLQGTIHQGNNLVFPVYYGVQCCSASIVACAYGLFHDPSLWTAKDIDACVHVGTNVHAKSCQPNYKGFLFPHEIIKTFTLPNNVEVFLQAAEQAKYIGPIHNIEGFGDDIVSALTTHFQTSRCGILTCNEYSFAMMFADSKFWIFDSHAKDVNGRCSNEGFAVLISFSCINELVLYLQPNFNNLSTYSITEIKFEMLTPVSNHIGDSFQNQPGLPVSNHIGDSFQNQPGLSVSNHIGDSFQNQPGLPVSNHIGDSFQNQPGFTWPLGGSSQNQPGSDVEKDSLKNQPHLLTCPLGDSSQNHPGTDYGTDSIMNLPIFLTCPIGDSSQDQPGPQYGLKGSCVNVPTDLNSTVSILPRNLTESETILIKLQRRMEDKVPYSYDLIRPERVYKAAEFLVQSEIYKKHNITLDTNWLHNVQTPVEVITVENENNLTSNSNSTENNLNHGINENFQTPNLDPNLSHMKSFQKPKQNKFQDIFFDTDSNASSSCTESSDSETEIGNHETMVIPDILPDHITNDIGLKIAPGEGKVPISLLQDEDVDILTYPSIYCGKARHFQLKLTDSQLRKFEIKSSDHRAAKHIPKLFMSFCKSRLRRFVNRISIAMRKKKNGKSLTAGQILQPNGLDQLIQEDEGYKILDEDRSSPAYWCQKTKEAMAMIRQYGPAHIFATLTAAEVYWHELITILIKINNEQELTEEEVKLLPKLEKIDLIKQDPVTCAWYFHHKFQSLMKVIQNTPLGPFKNFRVCHFVSRYEAQKRGSLHAHAMFWLEGCPTFNPDDEESIKTCETFIDEFITCEQDTENCLSHDEDNEPYQNNFNWIPLKNKAGYIKLRLKPKTIRFRNYNLIDDEFNYFREQVMLYHPWHNEQNIIDNAKEIYEKNVTTININREKYNFNMSIDLDKMMEEINTHNEEYNSGDEAQDICLSDDFKIFELGTVDSDIALEIPTMKTDDDTPKFGTFTVPKAISNQEYIDLLSSLNEKQTKYHDNFLHLIKSNTKEQFFHFISGPGGVGKSTLLNAITHTATRFWSHQIGNDPADVHIILSAPTGKAAFNIQGQTIHSIFGLDFDLKKELKTKMSANKRNTLMYKLKKLKILVIDEISMVSYDMMEVINLRLQQIFENNLPFGSVSLICLGDFNQLPPIYSTPVYQPSKDTMSILSNASNEITVIHSEHGSNETFYMSKLRSLFELYELTQFMRQKNDLKFAAALLRFANGKTTDEDDAMFESRQLSTLNIPEDITIPDATAIALKNITVDNYNETCLSKDFSEG
ncbi:ATP-dependent DNA helicase [Frankliniella fusca]|uniref:ATP-dependent DNA helicase n=1 Tax=Frankliniella fusca TaxID=407009 RepID=A0AAE1L7J4_9NEOP|nr:ATP-dependent DNA helicase [Frankliniella fusca]